MSKFFSYFLLKSVLERPLSTINATINAPLSNHQDASRPATRSGVEMRRTLDACQGGWGAPRFQGSLRSAFYRPLNSVTFRPDGAGVTRYEVPCVVGNESVWPS